MALTAKEKELTAVGISIAAGCKPCTDYHVKAVRKAGATDAEIRRAIDTAVAVRKDAAGVMESYGFEHLGIEKGSAGPCCPGEPPRIDALVSVGAAFAVNCTTGLKRHLAAARGVGVTDDEVTAVAKLAVFIKARAASHVDSLVAPKRAAMTPDEHAKAAAFGCG
jgi:AhpD family alkylhydroperoxidase